jgi:hypothetical protein
LRKIDPQRTQAEMDSGHLRRFVEGCNTHGCD